MNGPSNKFLPGAGFPNDNYEKSESLHVHVGNESGDCITWSHQLLEMRFNFGVDPKAPLPPVSTSVR